VVQFCKKAFGESSSQADGEAFQNCPKFSKTCDGYLAWQLPFSQVNMNTAKRLHKLHRAVRRQTGQSLVEYALILALISVVAILVLRGVGTSVNRKLTSVNSNLQ
jgi:Flp pilus assembly pilin Flp